MEVSLLGTVDTVSQFCSLGVWKQGWQSWFFLRAVRENVSHASLLAFGGFRCSLPWMWSPQVVQPTRLLHPWDSLRKNIGVGSHSLLQGTFLTQGSSPDHFTSPALIGGFFTTSTNWEVLFLQIKGSPIYQNWPFVCIGATEEALFILNEKIAHKHLIFFPNWPYC